MTQATPPRPTDAELNILRALWRLGPSTVRVVCEQLNRSRRTGYTTVLKLLQIMTDKGLVERDETNRAHVYRPKYPQAQTQRQLAGDLMDRAFEGSLPALLAQAVAARPVSREVLEEARRVLEAAEGGVTG